MDIDEIKNINQEIMISLLEDGKRYENEEDKIINVINNVAVSKIRIAEIIKLKIKNIYKFLKIYNKL